MKISAVYQIVVAGTKDSYIGSSTDYGQRRSSHLACLHRKRHPVIALQQLYDRLGREAITFRMLEECEPHETFDREAHWIGVLSPTLNTRRKTRSGRRPLWKDAISVMLPKGMPSQLADAAAAEGIDRSALFAKLIGNYLRKLERAGKGKRK